MVEALHGVEWKIAHAIIVLVQLIVSAEKKYSCDALILVFEFLEESAQVRAIRQSSSICEPFGKELGKTLMKEPRTERQTEFSLRVNS